MLKKLLGYDRQRKIFKNQTQIMNLKKLLLQILFVVLLVTPLSSATFGNVLFRTNDGSNDIVRVPRSRVNDFRRYAEMYKQNEGMRSTFDSYAWNTFWKSEFGLSDRQLSTKQIAHLGTLNSEWSRNNAVEYWLNSSFADGMAFVLSEVVSQWTNPQLVVAGLSAGLLGWQATGGSMLKDGGHVVARDGMQYTKSNLKLGQQMHDAYKADLVNRVTTFKEFRRVQGIRPDFVDFSTKTIYELKPNNPRGIQQGWDQLHRYQNAFQQKYGGTWQI